MAEEPLVLTELRGPVSLVTLNRPRYRNAQNSALLYDLERALHAAAMNDEVRAIVLRGAGPAFSAGHDMGSPGHDIDVSYPRLTLWPDHVGKPAIESRLLREQEVFLSFCRRWRELPKPTLAAVQGACVAGGLMLAWACDLIVASEDAFFADPSVRQGGGGVEWFAHAYQMPVRLAKEFLFLGERIGARRAYEIGMVNRVVAADELESAALELAQKLAEAPPFGLRTAKRNLNFAEDQMGLQTTVEHAFGWHQLVHAYNDAQQPPPDDAPTSPG